MFSSPSQAEPLLGGLCRVLPDLRGLSKLTDVRRYGQGVVQGADLFFTEQRLPAWPDLHSKANWVQILRKHSANPVSSLIFSSWLVLATEWPDVSFMDRNKSFLTA